jgi:hypothetical protein
MVTLSITPDYLGRLIGKVRGLQAREGLVDEDSGSNASDDRMVGAMQDSNEDLSLLEVAQEIRGLNERQQAELVALLWVGRGDAEPEEWEATVEAARNSRDLPTERYLLTQPLTGEYWAEGAERLGVAVPVDTVAGS